LGNNIFATALSNDSPVGKPETLREKGVVTGSLAG
jgi:hypothetical protein